MLASTDTNTCSHTTQVEIQGVAGDCFICDKHARPESTPLVLAADDLVVVSHLPFVTPAGTADQVYLGYLFVEARRHVAEFGDLTGDEAAAVGRHSARASRALQVSEHAEHVYAAVIGHGVSHFHIHLIPRYPGTPREFWWTRVDEWPDAPRGDADAVAALIQRLRSVSPN
jgi:histidine triad (HIT) family protein